MDVGKLSQAQRIALAHLEGTALRLAGLGGTGEPVEDPVAELRAISADPMLLGLAAGTLSLAEWRTAAVELLRAAGADMQVAKEHAAWLRKRRDGRSGGPTF